MTLIVAMKSVSAIILAADSRGTIGDPRGLTAINDKFQKIHAIGTCGLALAGASEIGGALLDGLTRHGLNSIKTIDQAVDQVRKEAVRSFTEWFPGTPAQNWPGVLLTLAGYRSAQQPQAPKGAKSPPQPAKPAQAMIYLLNSQLSFAPQLFDEMPGMSGVPQYAVYLAHRYYDPTISTEKALALSEYLIAETASQDPKVGGPIHIAEITADNGYRELSEEEVAAIHAQNEELNQKLRVFFLKGGAA